MTVPGLSEKVHQIADQLSADATWEDVIEQVRFRKAVEEGVTAADRGEFATPEGVQRTFEKWGLSA